jgi:hypothetical protein
MVTVVLLKLAVIKAIPDVTLFFFVFATFDIDVGSITRLRPVWIEWVLF